LTPRIHVAAAVILAADQRILIARRHENKHQGGLWEFPGGKVESDETVAAALHRELREELAISVQSAEPFIEVQHDYADKAVLLDVWWVRAFSGQPQGNEGQPLQWVTVAELADYAFPAANQPIIDALQWALQQD
tara:strand:+ start:23754 stop:24158 length:405 start_codon:yes stop_codon:yes gene_type:complete